MDWLEIASYGLADAKGIVPVVSSASDSAVASAAKCGDVVVNSSPPPTVCSCHDIPPTCVPAFSALLSVVAEN